MSGAGSAALTAYRRIVSEDAWRAAVPSDVAEQLPATARPLPGEDAADDNADLTAAARMLTGGWLRMHGLASRGQAGITFALASDLTGAASVVRRLVATPDPDQPIGLAPDPEVSLLPASQLVDEVLRLLPARAEAAAAPRPDVVPVSCPPELTATLVRALRADDQAVVRAVCAQLGTEEPPALLTSLATLRGEFSLALSAPGSSSQVLRLLLGTDGWVETSVDAAGVHHRRVGLDDLRDVLTTAIAGAAERATRLARDRRDGRGS
ncbi:hypothetical protein [Nocardioides massiliensis]|uniref:EspG family protein n=1 Tax=Nocardioides massiliensis TaxID=1325935 RepID=A0ABT9NND7_9ACTN|nr:hypothetical protein [Nocardioides massiliensis]MDP9821565.1 hypothetical protein [Nocardioides massiliensis]